MSIENIKAKIARFPSQGIMFTKEEILPLITTIESQQTQISGYKDVYHNEWLKQSAEKDALIESQKEEINGTRYLHELLESQKIQIAKEIKIQTNYRIERDEARSDIKKAEATIESQKVEIVRLRVHQEHFIYGESEEGHTFIERLEKQIEGYKAITELAVKGLEESKTAFKWAVEYHIKTCTCPECNALGAIEFTISEIARIQNAQT